MPGWWGRPGVSTVSPVSQGSNPRDSSAHQSSSLPGLGVRGAHSVLTPAPGARSLVEQSSMWHPDLLRKQMTQDCDKWKRYLGVNQLYIWLWVVENMRQAKDVGRKEEMNEKVKFIQLTGSHASSGNTKECSFCLHCLCSGKIPVKNPLAEQLGFCCCCF